MLRFISRVWENFKEYFILTFLLILSFISLSLNQNPAIKKVRAIAFGSFAASTAIFSDIVNIAKVKSENERLRKINAELMLQVNKLREYGVVNSTLKNLINLKDTVKYPLIPALTVSKSFTIAQGTITLNAGSENGVKAGMPVINDRGLVGIIYATSNNFSIARTLKNFELKLVVKDERSRVDGILKWNGEDLVIVNVPKTYDIEPGDRIVCSELSSIVSLPVPVGVVAELKDVQTGIFNSVKINPYVDFSRIENVFIIGVLESKMKNDLELNFFNK
ncbi:MAG: rod shape-determining protein MreC [Ignavibacteriaceae bacterium]|nr:rod shape-determining protein MreC [Ignavibacteriaceae bacterium]